MGGHVLGSHGVFITGQALLQISRCGEKSINHREFARDLGFVFVIILCLFDVIKRNMM